jgi:predicted DNA-binding transcriptional regulator YafY
LANELEVPLRTVYRDLDAIQEAGFPIYTDREGKNSGSSDKCVIHSVRGVDLEGEEFEVSISISLALHGFDLIVGCLQWSCGDAMVVVGQE